MPFSSIVSIGLPLASKMNAIKAASTKFNDIVDMAYDLALFNLKILLFLLIEIH